MRFNAENDRSLEQLLTSSSARDGSKSFGFGVPNCPLHLSAVWHRDGKDCEAIQTYATVWHRLVDAS